MTPAEDWELLQRELAGRVVVPGGGIEFELSEQVLALDVQYADDAAHVGASLHRADGTLLSTFAGVAPVEAPYVPGYFCFREGPPLLAMVARLRAEGLAQPQLLVVDGHGVAHPRRFGVACWLGLACELPALGCAKETLLRYEGEPGPRRGDALALDREGEHLGWILRTQDDVRPVFASPGHLVPLLRVPALILQLGGPYRVPDPLRFADQVARARARDQLEPATQDLGALAPVAPPWEQG